MKYFLPLFSLLLLVSGPVMGQDTPAVVDPPTVEAVDAPGTPEAAAAPEAAPAPEVAPDATDAAPATTDEVTTPEETIPDVSVILTSLQSKNWPLAVGAILTLLVFIANKIGLKKLVGKKAIPWVTMAIAICGTAGAGLVAGLGWLEGIIQGILAGVVAIGGWELILKNLTGKTDEKKAEEA